MRQVAVHQSGLIISVFGVHNPRLISVTNASCNFAQHATLNARVGSTARHDRPLPELTLHNSPTIIIDFTARGDDGKLENSISVFVFYLVAGLFCDDKQCPYK
jgi:hypothetical protein